MKRVVATNNQFLTIVMIALLHFLYFSSLYFVAACTIGIACHVCVLFAARTQRPMCGEY